MQSVVAWPNSYLDSAIMAGDKDAFVYTTLSVKIKGCVYICDPVDAFVTNSATLKTVFIET